MNIKRQLGEEPRKVWTPILDDDGFEDPYEGVDRIVWRQGGLMLKMSLIQEYEDGFS